MTKDGESASGLVGTVREVCAGLVDGLSLRLELFAVELQREKRRVFATVFLAMSASLAGFMALLFANIALVVMFWEHRLVVVLALAVAHLVMALIFGLIVRRRIAGGRVPFPATTAELRKDAAAIGAKQ